VLEILKEEKTLSQISSEHGSIAHNKKIGKKTLKIYPNYLKRKI
jgi:hypothetical protein